MAVWEFEEHFEVGNRLYTVRARGNQASLTHGTSFTLLYRGEDSLWRATSYTTESTLACQVLNAYHNPVTIKPPC